MWTSVMWFGVKACTVVACWTGGDGTLNVMMRFGIGEANFSTEGALFVATSSASWGVQKKEYSEDGVGCGDVGTFDGDAISFVFSASGFQKNERSEMGFVRGDTGDETIFLGGAIQNFTTCCMGVSCDGTVVVVIFLAGKAFREMTS